jgi:hypothetical protein
MISLSLLLTALVGGFCAIQTRWVIPAIVFLTQTLFNLSQYFVVPLSVGYAEPLESLLICALVGVAIRNREFNRFSVLGMVPPDLQSSVLCLSLYCLWITLCVTLNLRQNAGTAGFNYSVRFLLAGVVPWMSLLIVMSIKREIAWVFRSLEILARGTALVHLTIQVLDLRTIMSSAYWLVPASGEYADVVAWNQAQLYSAEFVRALPQGFYLIVCFAIYSFTKKLLVGESTKVDLIWSLVLSFALLVTFTRSVLLVLAVSSLLVPAYGLYLRVLSVRTLGKLMSAPILVAIGASAMDAARPGFLELWADRLFVTAERDGSIFSIESGNRGLDNLASLEVIKQNFFFGTGVPRYSTAEALREDSATDIHPLLQLGLVGGVPAIVLFIAFGVLLNLAILGRLSRLPKASRKLGMATAIPICMMQFAVNFIGVGGTVAGPILLVIVVFIAHNFQAYSSDSAARGSPLRDRSQTRWKCKDLALPFPLPANR